MTPLRNCGALGYLVLLIALVALAIALAGVVSVVAKAKVAQPISLFGLCLGFAAMTTGILGNGPHDDARR